MVQAKEMRVSDILKALALPDAGNSNAIHDILVTQYHELRVRDAAIDTRLKVEGKEVHRGLVPRTFSTLLLTLPRFDDALLFDARIDL